MRTALATGLLITLSGCATTETVTDYKLYYLGGQSNMDGYGYNAELTADHTSPHAGVRIYRGASKGDDDVAGGVGLWDQLRPGYGVGFDSDGTRNALSERFGPELSFGHRIAILNGGAPIAIIKYSRGGTPLYIDGEGYGTWNPDIAGRNQYDFALRSIHDARSDTDIDGDGTVDRLTPAGIIWMQGEADAFDSEEAAVSYEANLRRMMDLFRAALGVDDLPVVIGQITDSGRADDGTVMDWSDEVRRAQASFAESDACATLVTDTNDFNYPADDDWHYDSDAYLRMGVAFADAVDRLEKSCPP